MEQKTVKYKRTLRGSVGAGVGALFNGNGRRYFILEHKDASKYHKAGDSQKIIIDQIELGRDKNCQVRFDDESFPTVSRRLSCILNEFGTPVNARNLRLYISEHGKEISDGSAVSRLASL